MILGDLVAEGLEVFKRLGYGITELGHKWLVVVNHKLGQVVAHAVNLAAEGAVSHPIIILERGIWDQPGEIEREVVSSVRYTPDQAWLGKDDVRPTLIGIVKEQHF